MRVASAFVILVGLVFAPSSQAMHVYSDLGELLPDSAFFEERSNVEAVAPADDYTKNAGALFWSQGYGWMPQHCSAFLIDALPEGEPDANAPAYAITSGHCYSADETMEVHVNAPDDGLLREFHVDLAKGASKHRLGFERVEYSTNFGYDIQIVSLRVSARELRKLGYRGFKIADALPREGAQLELLSMPDADRGLQRGRCVASGAFTGVTTRMGMGDGLFINVDYLAHDCSVILRTSGGPILDARTHEVVAVNAQGRSLSDRFHETFPNAARAWVRDANQASSVAGLSRCFDSRGIFDLDSAGCPLPKPFVSKNADLLDCSQGHRLACLRVGDFEQGCTLGDAASCGLLANRLIGGERLDELNPETRIQGFKAAVLSCFNGMSYGCNLIMQSLADPSYRGEMQSVGVQGLDYEQLILQSALRSCDDLDQQGCLNLLEVLRYAVPSAGTTDLRVGTLANLCAFDSALHCEELAKMVEVGAIGLDSSKELAAEIRKWVKEIEESE